VIAANEEMARFMILADACLADQDKVGAGASATMCTNMCMSCMS
jgi:hypothetical protein